MTVCISITTESLGVIDIMRWQVGSRGGDGKSDLDSFRLPSISFVVAMQLLCPDMLRLSSTKFEDGFQVR